MKSVLNLFESVIIFAILFGAAIMEQKLHTSPLICVIQSTFKFFFFFFSYNNIIKEAKRRQKTNKKGKKGGKGDTWCCQLLIVIYSSVRSFSICDLNSLTVYRGKD